MILTVSKSYVLEGKPIADGFKKKPASFNFFDSTGFNCSYQFLDFCSPLGVVCICSGIKLVHQRKSETLETNG